MVITETSTNGRWGVQIQAPDGTKFPAEGTLRPLGEMGGFRCFEFTPGQTGVWTIQTGEVRLVAGCSAPVLNMGLQSNYYVSLLQARPGAVWEVVGYKGRSSRFDTLSADGSTPRVPVAALLALGLMEPDEAPVPVDAPPDDGEARSTVLLALQRAGLA